MPENNGVHPRKLGVNSLDAGVVLGESYEIVEQLGSGGFGIVYEAKDLHNRDELVAIKEYFPRTICGRDSVTQAVVAVSTKDKSSFDKGVDAFIEEALLLRNITHPGVVRVHHIIREFGNVYCVMKRLHGGSLEARLDNGHHFDDAEVRTLLLKILDALAYVHSKGVIHRDISPSNIVIDEVDAPVLIDFGASRNVVGNASHLLTAIARQGYTPQEQYDDHGLEMQTAATDFYALGATFYHLMTGSVPVSALSRKSNNDKLRALSEMVGSKYSPNLVKSVERAMAIEAKGRWQSAQDWINYLTPGETPPIWRFLKRLAIWIGLMGLGAFLLAVLLYILYLLT